MSTTLGIVRPSKKREIEGVSASSVVNLKATLFQAQQEAKKPRVNGGNGGSSGRGLVIKNRGVEERARRDEEQLEKELDPQEELQKKSLQYRNFTKDSFRDDDERYMVDFEQKGWSAQPKEFEDDPTQILQAGNSSLQKLEQRMILQEIAQQTSAEREKAQQLKEQKQAALQKRLELKKKAKEKQAKEKPHQK